MGADAGKEELKYGTINNYLSSKFICVNSKKNRNNVWCLMNSKNTISSFSLPVEWQNFIDSNLLNGVVFLY